MIGKCALCEKEKHITKHHVIPKSVTKKINPNHTLKDTTLKLCDDCHKAIHHSFVDHIFQERNITGSSKIEILKLHIAKQYISQKHPEVWKSFRKHWKTYIKEEFEKLSDV